METKLILIDGDDKEHTVMVYPELREFVKGNSYVLSGTENGRDGNYNINRLLDTELDADGNEVKRRYLVVFLDGGSTVHQRIKPVDR